MVYGGGEVRLILQERKSLVITDQRMLIITIRIIGGMMLIMVEDPKSVARLQGCIGIEITRGEIRLFDI